MVQTFHDARQSQRHLLAELLQVARHGGHSQEAKGYQSAHHEEQEEENCDSAEGLESPDPQVAYKLHQRLQHHGKQSTDVQQQQDVADYPCDVAEPGQARTQM